MSSVNRPSYETDVLYSTGAVAVAAAGTVEEAGDRRVSVIQKHAALQRVHVSLTVISDPRLTSCVGRRVVSNST